MVVIPTECHVSTGLLQDRGGCPFPAVQGLGADPVRDGRPGVGLKSYVWWSRWSVTSAWHDVNTSA